MKNLKFILFNDLLIFLLSLGPSRKMALSFLGETEVDLASTVKILGISFFPKDLAFWIQTHKPH